MDVEKSLDNRKFYDYEKEKIINEADQINILLDKGLRKEHYLDMKLLTSLVGFHSILLTLTKGETQQKYYDQGMFYIDKMKILSPKNPINDMAKENLDLFFNKN
jgi:hypothetical protein